METERTGLVVPIPEAEPLVGAWRAELDAHAAAGVPAHVTVLAPFLEPAAIDDDVLAGLRDAVGSVPAFTATFARVGWFGDHLVWLAPEPHDPFVALTTAVHERFGLAPYGGEHGTDVVPHLTVAHDAPPERLRVVAADLERGLPFRAEVSTAHLMVGSREPGSWRTLATVPLGGSQSGAQILPDAR